MRRVLFFPVFLCIAVIVFAAEKPVLEVNDEGGDIVIRSVDPRGPRIFSKLHVCLIDKSGVELTAIAGAEPGRVPGPVRQRFRFGDGEIILAYCFDPASRLVVYRVESPYLASGDVSIGILFPAEKHLSKVAIAGNRATFEGKRGKTLIGWTDSATLTAPKPRKKLDVSLAEYGATNRWTDVTTKVSDLIVGDSLVFRADNELFTDTVPGVVKSLVLNYSLDDDELIETISENQNVRIQFDPKDKFFRLAVDEKSTFEFAITAGLPSLPETLPTFEEAKKHAASVNLPLIRGGGMFNLPGPPLR